VNFPIKATRAERQMAAPLVLILLFAPSTAIIAYRIMGDAGAWPLWIPLILLLALLIVLAAGVYRRDRAALTPAACAYAFGWTALIEAAYGIVILITGRLPNKYDPIPVPRSSAITRFLFAVGWCTIAFGLSRWDAHRRKAL